MYPERYPNNAICRYYVGASGYGFDGVRLKFNEFDLEDSQGCQNDNFIIYEGRIDSSTIVETKCGRVTGDFFSKSRNLIIVFQSNSLISGKGFSIDVDRKYFPFFIIITFHMPYFLDAPS